MEIIVFRAQELMKLKGCCIIHVNTRIPADVGHIWDTDLKSLKKTKVFSKMRNDGGKNRERLAYMKGRLQKKR